MVLAEKFSCVKHADLIVFSKIEIHITSHLCEGWDGPIDEEYYYRHALNLPKYDVDMSWVGDILTFAIPVTRIVADIEHGGECLNM